MSYFFVEIPINVTDRHEVGRASRMLSAAHVRLRRRATTTGTLFVGVVAEDRRLVCLIEAPDLDVLRRLIALAMLPAGRIREVIHLSRALDADRSAG